MTTTRYVGAQPTHTTTLLAELISQEQGMTSPVARRRSAAIPTATGTSGSGGQRPPTCRTTLAHPDDHGPSRPVQSDDLHSDIVDSPITKITEEDHDYDI